MCGCAVGVLFFSPSVGNIGSHHRALLTSRTVRFSKISSLTHQTEGGREGEGGKNGEIGVGEDEPAEAWETGTLVGDSRSAWDHQSAEGETIKEREKNVRSSSVCCRSISVQLPGSWFRKKLEFIDANTGAHPAREGPFFQ